MGDPKKQHWVPKFYLRHFATDETRDTDSPRIWALPREGALHNPRAVRDSAVKNYLYSPVAADGSRSFEMERQFDKVETFFGEHWPRFAYQDVGWDEHERQAMSLFIALLILRNPSQLTRLRTTREALLHAFDRVKQRASLHGSPVAPTMDEEALSTNLDFEKFRAISESDLEHDFVANIRRSARSLAMLLIAKNSWRVLVAQEPLLATSDRPVMIMGDSGLQYGDPHPGATVAFPLSPYRLLLISDAELRRGTILPISAEDAGMFNSLTYRNALRFMYTPCDPVAICVAMLPFLAATDSDEK